jgi:hypothetical protein
MKSVLKKARAAFGFSAAPHVIRSRTLDMHTYGTSFATHDSQNNAMGVPLPFPCRTVDGRTVDSTGAFLVGELERLDQTLHEPLASVSWPRDIDLREDVTIADEVSSFTLSTYGSQGGLGTGNGIGTGKAWIGKNTDQISGVGVDIAKIPNPLTPWALEIKYTILELESAAKLGRPVDQQKYAGLQLKHQMDVDEMVYIGDTPMEVTGLVNNARVTNVTNVANGAQGTPGWMTKTPAEILQDVNEILTSAWSASAWAVIPDRLLLPPRQFGYISTQPVTAAGDKSILKYLMENNLMTTSGRGKIDILPVKWLTGAGAGGVIGVDDGHDRMMVYQKDKDRVRYPMTMLQRTPIQYMSIYHQTTYFCRLGVVEVVYPETIAYRDGI